MAALRVLEGFRYVSSTEVIGDEIHIRYEMDLSAVESALKNQGIEIRMIEPAESELEDVFLELLGAAKHAKPALHVAPPGGKLTQAAVESHRVTRRFNDFVAVDSVDLQVRRGEILGLLGPNGAGKTTLIKMMCGLLEPSSGEIHVAGFNIRTEKQRVWREIGYMSQRFSLYRDLSVQQNLRLYSDLYGISNSGYDAMTESLGLVEFRSRLAGDLPIGVRQRLSLLCAVLHGPQVLFLDEPTSGVDPPARRIFWDLIYSLSRESAVTVLVSTHYMDEADHCDRLGLMDQGRLIALDSPSALKQISERSSGKLLTVRAPQLHAAWDAILPAFPGAILYGTSIRLRSLNPWSDERRIQMLLGREGIERARISEQSLSMDETFIDFIRTSEASHA
jgi:ABC-2 type transport system ATP-binding protein